MQKITPFLWFADNNAEEAVNYYMSVFKNSKLLEMVRYPEDESIDEHFVGMAGKVLTADFELDGVRLMALDGGPSFRLNESISLLVECEDQAEIDYFWEKLSHVPESEQCGWCKDKFGLSWQIVPKRMGEIVSTNPHAIKAMMTMKKISIAQLESAQS